MDQFRCGYVAIVGRPNVGKSTLTNRIVGQKVSITTHKPQTTRHRVHGIKTTESSQMILVDTPGLHKNVKKELNRLMNKAASSALSDVDVILFLVDSTEWKDEDQFVLSRVRNSSIPFIIVVNKADKIKDKTELLPHLKHLSEAAEHDRIIPVSARQGDNIEELEILIEKYLPEGEPIYSEDHITDRSMRFHAAELIREKLMRRLGQELPYSVAVEIENFSEENGKMDIGAVIWVERAGQKGIVIGKDGHLLKEIGTKARIDMEAMFDSKIYLQLWVKVKEGWSENERLLRNLGLGDQNSA